MGCVTFLLHNNNWQKLESHLGQRGVDWSQAVGIKTKRNKHKTEMWGEQEIKCVGEWDWVREETGETSHHIKSPSHSRALRFGLWIMDSSVLNMDESLPTIQPWSEWGASVWSVCLYTFAHIHTHTHTHTQQNKAKTLKRTQLWLYMRTSSQWNTSERPTLQCLQLNVKGITELTDSTRVQHASYTEYKKALQRRQVSNIHEVAAV